MTGVFPENSKIQNSLVLSHIQFFDFLQKDKIKIYRKIEKNVNLPRKKSIA